MTNSKKAKEPGREPEKELTKVKSMAVLVMPLRERCLGCPCCDDELACWGNGGTLIEGETHDIDEPGPKPKWCPLKKAIGIIEPNGHVVYLREEERE